jgi:predicted GNAT family acetyltransferase
MSDGLKTTSKTIEIERDGEVAFLGYETDADGWISLLHTWVPPALRGRGIANELAEKVLEFAKAEHLKVEVIWPVVFHFLTKHPEYKKLVGIRVTNRARVVE